MILDLVGKHIEILFLIITIILLLLIFTILKLLKDNKKLSRRIEILENFDNILDILSSKREITNDLDIQPSSNKSLEREKTKRYEGKTKLDRLVNEYKDTVIHKKSKKIGGQKWKKIEKK